MIDYQFGWKILLISIKNHMTVPINAGSDCSCCSHSRSRSSFLSLICQSVNSETAVGLTHTHIQSMHLVLVYQHFTNV